MKLVALFTSILLIFGCENSNSQKVTMTQNSSSTTNAIANDTITLGAGCFWCVEAAFMQLKGVVSAKSGYSGGFIKNPSYKEVCNGNTGHAEVVQIVFDSTIISVATILEAFFTVHDPTQLNRQGNDIGTQYRSAIFYHSESQKEIAEKAVKAANESGEWDSPIVTEVKAFDVFYPAEDYHDNYYNLNKDQPYCSMVITPKMNKFKKKFHQLIQE
jgi:peptide-methionine (S)-S-oxide reductase